MKGKYKVRVRNSRNTYVFELRRNITVLLGNSGTGKTTLYDMIREYNRLGKESGVAVSCDKNVIALDEARWELELDHIQNSIVVIDEDHRFIRSHAFAERVKGADNYFLLITREYLPQLPYSVDEIFELTGAKNKKFKHAFEETYRMYHRPVMSRLPFKPEVIITEDSGSGFQFFGKEAERVGIVCESAGGKANVYDLLRKHTGKRVVVTADGAAFGSEIRQIAEQQILTPDAVAIFLPESFEWLILKSGLVKGAETVLDTPEQQADSQKYMSWEQYFTEALIELTKGSRYQKYQKGKLAEFYLQDKSVKAIKENVKGLNLD